MSAFIAWWMQWNQLVLACLMIAVFSVAFYVICFMTSSKEERDAKLSKGDGSL